MHLRRGSCRLCTIALGLMFALTSRAAAGRKANPLAALSANIREVTRQVTPAVVEILVAGYASGEGDAGKTSNEIARQQSSGSGVIVDPEGFVMTNAHVVEGAVSLRVVIGRTEDDNAAVDSPATRTFDARVVGMDRESDLALLRIDAGLLPALRFADSDTLRQGDLVLAIGSPMLLRNSLSMGVVSAAARPVRDDDPILYIQTDASINPGDSGGALVDADGRLVGLNTFIMSKSGGNEGIGFAIPAGTVRNVYQQLRQNGVVARGSIGVFVQNITDAMAKGLELPVQRGVLVSDVDPDGPADNAGLRRRDVIVSFNRTAIGSSRQLRNAIFQARAGDKIKLGIRRGQTELESEVVVSARSTPPPSLATLIAPGKSLIRRLGVYCIELSGEAADLIPDLKRHYGLVVAGKSPDGQAQFIDLRPGDVIHAFNNLPIASLDLFRDKIEDLKQGDPVALQIERDGLFQYVAFDIE